MRDSALWKTPEGIAGRWTRTRNLEDVEASTRWAKAFLATL